MNRLNCTLVRELDIEFHPEQRALHVAAGSGLELIGSSLFVAIDDELHVGAFTLDEESAGRLVRVFPGSLPAEHRARKAAKPDVECLFAIPGVPDGALLAGVPSGSTPRRTRGFHIALGSDGDVEGDPRDVDWQPLLEALDSPDGDIVNIEGATTRGNELLLFVRGVTGGNRVARLDRTKARAGLLEGRVPADALIDIANVDLGMLDGIPLGFTDAAQLDAHRIVVTASAEDTDNPYEDGVVAGSAVLLLDEKLRVTHRWSLDPAVGKVEGVAVARGAGRADLWLVTDDDDSDSPSRLYRCRLDI